MRSVTRLARNLFVFFVLAAWSTGPALATADCAELGGGIVFKDTLYGGGTGVVLTGLALVAAQDQDNAGQKLALGTLIGAGIGTTFGIAEVLLRDCRPQVLQPGLQVPSVFQSGDGKGGGVLFTYVLAP